MILQKELKKLGILLEIETGHLFYDSLFVSPQLSIEIVMLRHGETYGNCGQSTAQGEIDYNKVNLGIKNRGQRIYQGDVNKAINQLTQVGQEQALQAAIKLENEFLMSGWVPDVILHSPLSRAKETGIPFVKRNGFERRYDEYIHVKEMCFGAWENRRICDLDQKNSCHLLYLTQNALVKESGVNAHGEYQEGQCFAEVLLKANDVLHDLNQHFSGKKILLFTHSMFGAACSIVIGKGQKIENGNYLAFDGKRQDETSYTLAHASPFVLC